MAGKKLSKEVRERRRRETAAASTLAALFKLETGRNYAPGWALRVWNARQKAIKKSLKNGS